MVGYYAGARLKGTFWQKHSLSIVLISVMLAQTIISVVFGYQVWLEEQDIFNLPTTNKTGFWIWWTYEYHTSLVADVFGAILLVLLSKRLREIGSAEDKGNEP